MPRDYIQRLFARWRPDSGVVVSVPIAARPANFWAELECAFLNTYQARWEYVSDTLGLGFAQGKNMLFRRDILEAAGGIRALGAEIAEDAATTKLIRAVGRSVHVMDSPFEQPLGRRRVAEIWARQVRWSRLRRITFPALFIPEILTGCVPPLIAAIYFAMSRDLSVGLVAALLLAIWFAAEGGAGALRRLAFLVAHAAGDADPRPDAAGTVGRCLAQRRGRLARQHRQRGENASRAVARTDITSFCLRETVYQPPSTPMAWPVTKPASSEAR
jgi:hypothetical protein